MGDNWCATNVKQVSTVKGYWQTENIPALLQSIPNWCRFQTERVPGVTKLKKKPICVASGWGWRIAKPEKGRPDDDQLATFDEARAALQPNEYLGFRLTPESGVVCIDLDAVINLKTGAIRPEALKLIKQFDSYTELSCSGDGFHTLLINTRPLPHGAHGELDGYVFEMYHKARFMLLTGEVIRTVGGGFRNQTEIVDGTELIHRLFIPSENGEYDLHYRGNTKRRFWGGFSETRRIAKTLTDAVLDPIQLILLQIRLVFGGQVHPSGPCLLVRSRHYFVGL